MEYEILLCGDFICKSPVAKLLTTGGPIRIDMPVYTLWNKRIDVGGKLYKISIHDVYTCHGSEILRARILKNIPNIGIVLIYSNKSSSSVEYAMEIYKELTEGKGTKKFPLILVEDHSNLNREITVTAKERKKLKKKLKCPLVSISTSNFREVENVFLTLMKKMDKHLHREINNLTTLSYPPGLNEYRIMILGERFIGASSIISTMYQGKTVECFQLNCSFQYNFKNTNYILHIVESDHFDYSEADGFVIMYSITSRESFDNTAKLHQCLVNSRTEESLPLIIVGNKMDIEFKREVHFEEGVELAQTMNASFAETSKDDTESVKNAFHDLLEQIIDKTF